MKRPLRQCVVGLAVVMAGVAFAATARAQSPVCGTQSTMLIAGQHFIAGTISIYNDATNIYVTFTTAETPWVMSEAHVAIASALSGIPQTKAGNPIPGRFAYNATFDPEVTVYTFGIPYAGLFDKGQNLFIAAHSMVQAPRDQGGSQTGWGQGTNFPGHNWAMYLNYTLQACGGGGNS